MFTPRAARPQWSVRGFERALRLRARGLLGRAAAGGALGVRPKARTPSGPQARSPGLNNTLARGSRPPRLSRRGRLGRVSSPHIRIIHCQWRGDHGRAGRVRRPGRSGSRPSRTCCSEVGAASAEGRRAAPGPAPAASRAPLPPPPASHCGRQPWYGWGQARRAAGCPAASGPPPAVITDTGTRRAPVTVVRRCARHPPPLPSLSCASTAPCASTSRGPYLWNCASSHGARHGLASGGMPCARGSRGAPRYR